MPRAVEAAAAAPPPTAEAGTAEGTTAPTIRRGAAEAGPVTIVGAAGAPPCHREAVARVETEATGQAPAMGHPATHAVKPERHVAAVTAAAVVVVSPAARAVMVERAAAMTPCLPHNVAAQEICQRARPMPCAI